MLRRRLRRPGEAAVRLEVHAGHGAAQALEQGRQHRAAGAAHTVQRDGEPPLPDALAVDVRQPQHRLDVARRGVGIRAADADIGPGDPWDLAPAGGEADQSRRRRGVEEQAVRPHELEGIPLDRVVARRDDHAAGGRDVPRRAGPSGSGPRRSRSP